MNNNSKKVNKIRCFLTVVLLLVNVVCVTAQVKVGDNLSTIDDDSMLELESTTKAFVPPRMTTAQMMAIPSPLVGAIIYNINEHCLHQYKSLNGTLQWISLCSGNEIISVKLETSYTGTIGSAGITKTLDGIETVNTINGASFNDATNHITLPAGTYNMVFSYEGSVNAGSGSSIYISSYFFDFPKTTGIARIHSNQAHKGGGHSNHGASINYVGTLAVAKTFAFHIGRGQAGTYLGSSDLSPNGTFFSAIRILK